MSPGVSNTDGLAKRKLSQFSTGADQEREETGDTQEKIATEAILNAQAIAEDEPWERRQVEEFVEAVEASRGKVRQFDFESLVPVLIFVIVAGLYKLLFG
eukprot:Clim_evm100s149 gene=Clim_evmTU100s149